MGEISEMVIEGILCELCGVYIGDATGYPRKCASCTKNSKNHKGREVNKKSRGPKKPQPRAGVK